MSKDIEADKDLAMSNEREVEKELAIGQNAPKRGLLTRLPSSTLSRVAFWTSLVGALAGVGGVVALTITNGSPSRDIVITMICGIVATILVVSRVRLMLWINILIGVYLLNLIFTEPFVTESLANPKGPNGGFGHFMGDVLIAANTIITFVCYVGIVVQDYRGGGRRAPRWFSSFLLGVLGLVIGASFIGALAHPVTLNTPATLTFTNGVPTLHMGPGKFDLTEATISKGSKLLIVDDTSEQHILTNGSWQQNTPVQKREAGAPTVNNLSFSGNSTAIGPFVTAGTYHIICLLHRGMELTITVQ